MQFPYLTTLLLVAGCCAAYPGLAQQPAGAGPAGTPASLTRVYKPVCLLNSRIAFSDSVLRLMKPAEISSITVYKGGDMPAR